MDYQFIPSVDWRPYVHIPIATQNQDGEYKTEYYECPSLDATESHLPPVTMHCSPYFVVWKAYWAITTKGHRLPAWARQEEDLIIQIGEIMVGDHRI